MFFQMVTLPPQNEMFHRLAGVSSDTHLLQKFYPLLMREASQSMTANEVVLLVRVAMDIYSREASRADLSVTNILAPQIIDAIVSDRAMAQKAKELFGTVM